MSARKVEPVPKATEVFPEHPFVPDIYGYHDPVSLRPTECSYVIDGVRCKFPKANGVHKSSEELAEALPPKPEADRSDEWIGEREEAG